MYVTRVPNRSSPPAVLLRESYRDGGKVKTRTLANLTDWPDAKVEALRRVLKGETAIVSKDGLSIERSLPHGHVAAVLGMARKLGLHKLLPGFAAAACEACAGHDRSAGRRACGQARDGTPIERGNRRPFAGGGAGTGRRR